MEYSSQARRDLDYGRHSTEDAFERVVCECMYWILFWINIADHFLPNELPLSSQRDYVHSISQPYKKRQRCQWNRNSTMVRNNTGKVLDPFFSKQHPFQDKNGGFPIMYVYMGIGLALSIAVFMVVIFYVISMRRSKNERYFALQESEPIDFSVTLVHKKQRRSLKYRKDLSYRRKSQQR